MTSTPDGGTTWRLYSAGELVGEIHEQERDFPWIRGRFHALPGFAPLRPLFTEWNRALGEDDSAAMEAAYDAIRAKVTMTYPDGRQVPEFLLGVEGEEAAFRWADEPFPDDKR